VIDQCFDHSLRQVTGDAVRNGSDVLFSIEIPARRLGISLLQVNAHPV
jgi:hypothetical protein